MKIDFKRFHLRLLVGCFPECFRFYRDVLGLPVRYGDETSAYAEFKSEAVHIALFQREQMAAVVHREALPAVSVSQDQVAVILRVEDVGAVYEKLLAAGAAFVTGPCERPEWNCRTAHLRDPDGNLIELNSDL